MRKSNVKDLVTAALFAAFIAVFTMFPQIRSPFGYTHFGDSIIYLAACVLPAPWAALAGAVGGALADVFTGYAYWAPATFLIKAGNTLPFLMLMRYYRKKQKHTDRIVTVGSVAAAVLSGAIFTVGGYFVASAIMYGLPAAVAELTTAYVQPTGSLIAFVALGALLDKMHFKNRIQRGRYN